MFSRRRFVSRAAVTAVVVALAALGVTGCSMIGPESSWTGSEGSVEGTVRSEMGSALAGIDIRMCGETAEGECVEYYATTDASGRYRVDAMELGQTHAYEMNYVVYVNRTFSSALPIVANYGTYVATVPVTVSGSCYDVVIASQGAGVPDEFIE